MKLVHVDDHVSSFVRDCRQCRDAGGNCSINDGFDALFREEYLPSDGVVFGTPLYWYGVSAQLKAFLDRMFCYIAGSCPDSAEVVRAMQGKIFGLLISSEETYPAAPAGIIHEIQEFARYNHSAFVGYVRGIGNKRGDVLRDPNDPIGKARALGRNLFNISYTDHLVDTIRSDSTWGAEGREDDSTEPPGARLHGVGS